MTKRDFEAIAHVLDANHAPLELVQDFADMLGEQNPRFNRELFIKASTILVRERAAIDLARLDRARGTV